MVDNRRFEIVVNPRAGGGRAGRLIGQVSERLQRTGVTFSVRVSQSIDHARRLAAAALDRNLILTAMGGDGLTAALAEQVRDRDGLLALLPVGRGNDFARKLGISGDPVTACRVLAQGTESIVDTANVGNRLFLGICSAGLDSDVQAIANSTRLPLARHVYSYSTLRALTHWRPADWNLTIDGQARTFTGYSVAVCNTGVFGGGMKLSPHSSLYDGKLEVLVIEDLSRLRFLTTLTRAFNGTHLNRPGIDLFAGTSVTFSANRPFVAYADGEAVDQLPVTITVSPKSLRVLTP